MLLVASKKSEWEEKSDTNNTRRVYYKLYEEFGMEFGMRVMWNKIDCVSDQIIEGARESFESRRRRILRKS